MAAIAAAIAAAGALAALRAGTDPAALGAAGANRPGRQEAQGGPVGPDAVVHDPDRPQPPFDRLPGRTPIPAPTLVYHESELVQGALPAGGTGPSARAAQDAARMVLGRYCRRPGAYLLQLDGKPDWSLVTVLVVRRSSASARRLATLRLRWTAGAYAWRGSSVELAGCS